MAKALGQEEAPLDDLRRRLYARGSTDADLVRYRSASATAGFGAGAGGSGADGAGAVRADGTGADRTGAVGTGAVGTGAVGTGVDGTGADGTGVDGTGADGTATATAAVEANAVRAADPRPMDGRGAESSATARRRGRRAGRRGRALFRAGSMVALVLACGIAATAVGLSARGTTSADATGTPTSNTAALAQPGVSVRPDYILRATDGSAVQDFRGAGDAEALVDRTGMPFDHGRLTVVFWTRHSAPAGWTATRQDDRTDWSTYTRVIASSPGSRSGATPATRQVAYVGAPPDVLHIHAPAGMHWRLIISGGG